MRGSTKRALYKYTYFYLLEQMQELDRFNIYCLLNYYSSFCSQHIDVLGQISQIVIVCYFTGLDE